MIKASGYTNSLGMIFDIQRFCINDGPGIRTTVFLKGCPLRCRWCHNPEGIEQLPILIYDSAKCVNCQRCVPACDKNCHYFENGVHLYNRNNCINCGKCADVCFSGALELSGKIVTVRNVLDIVVRDRTFYEKSGGGITISGGEPLFQPEFTKALLQTATEENIHTCIETSGYAPSRVIKEIIPYTNLFLFDYKETDSKRHEFYTGKGNKSIIDNLRRIDSAGKTIILRCPIIPQINDRLDHYQGIAMIANNFKNIVKIELLPYHPLGIKKRSAIDMEILYDNNSFMPKTAIEEIAEKIRSLTDKEIISH